MNEDLELLRKQALKRRGAPDSSFALIRARSSRFDSQ